ncbi:MAG: FHA domain-containing protein, partial [Bdellovibrionales bacterium]|nr:FHA domain-containing protein [Bdellovibrionales bacterium]
MKSQIELLNNPVEVRIMRDGKPLMIQTFQHSPIRLGRILDNDVVLPFDSVSRHHCEIHFVEDGGRKKWVLHDLKSLNGVSINGERVSSASFERNGEFEIKPVSIQIRSLSNEAVAAAEADQAISSTDETIIGPDPTPAPPKQHPAGAQAAYSTQPPPSRKRPMFNIDTSALMGTMHPAAESAKAKAVQVSVLWHDVVLSVDEFVPGEHMIIEINGIYLRLGKAGQARSAIRCPTGTTFLDRPGKESVLLPNAPATWVADDGIRILARYVPRSKVSRQGLIPMLEEELIDPVVISGVIHGAVAIATVTLGGHEPPKQ